MNRFTTLDLSSNQRKTIVLSDPLLKNKPRTLFHPWVSETTLIPPGRAPWSFTWTNLPTDQWSSNHPSAGEVFYQVMARSLSMGPHISKDLLKVKVSLTIFQLEPIEKKIGSLKPQIVLMVLDLLFPLEIISHQFTFFGK